jgi:hypothetical protein
MSFLERKKRRRGDRKNHLLPWGIGRFTGPPALVIIRGSVKRRFASLAPLTEPRMITRAEAGQDQATLRRMTGESSRTTQHRPCSVAFRLAAEADPTGPLSDKV